MKDAQVAAALDVSNTQAKAWLQRLVKRDVIEKRKKPVAYVVKQPSLFGPKWEPRWTFQHASRIDSCRSVLRCGACAIQQLLSAPMKDAEVAAALDVSNTQAKAWLQRLVEEGVIEKRKKPVAYVVKQ